MTQEQADYRVVVCPTCGKDITSDTPLWLLLGRWYCSEQCVRATRRMGLE